MCDLWSGEKGVDASARMECPVCCRRSTGLTRVNKCPGRDEWFHVVWSVWCDVEREASYQ